jgi:surface antigen
MHPTRDMRSASILLLAVLGSACATKSGTGTLAGAAAGGAIGGLVGGDVGLILGAAAGGAVGYTVGRSMDEEDRRRAAYALEENRRSSWRNPQTGYEYRVEPGETSYRDGRECREFRMYADGDGRPDDMRAIACRTPDGRWEAI